MKVKFLFHKISFHLTKEYFPKNIYLSSLWTYLIKKFPVHFGEDLNLNGSNQGGRSLANVLSLTLLPNLFFFFSLQGVGSQWHLWHYRGHQWGLHWPRKPQHAVSVMLFPFPLHLHFWTFLNQLQPWQLKSLISCSTINIKLHSMKSGHTFPRKCHVYWLKKKRKRR